VHELWPAVPAAPVQTLIEAAVAASKLVHADWELLPPPAPTPAPPATPTSKVTLDPSVLATSGALGTTSNQETQIKALSDQVQALTTELHLTRNAAQTDTTTLPVTITTAQGTTTPTE